MPRSEIDLFMRAMSDLESGGNPQARNAQSGAYGQWQIMPSNWGPWSRETFGRVVSQNAQNQRQVARHKLLQYYDQFGSWDAVSVAWFAGPGRARRYMNGDRRVLNMSDGNIPVSEYIKRINRNLNRHRQAAGGQRTAITPGDLGVGGGTSGGRGVGEDILQQFGVRQSRNQEQQQANMEQQLYEIFNNLSHRIAGGRRMSIQQIEEGQDLTPTDDMFSGGEYMQTARSIDDRVDMASSAVQEIFSRATREAQEGIEGAAQMGTAAGMRALHIALEQPGDIGVPENIDVEDDTPIRPLTISEGYEKGQALVDIASQYIGVPYQWGGTNPNRGLDCSGLIQLAARQMGITLPRVSRDQARAGTEVQGGLSNARPGDLVAFASRGLPVGHIGIYVGNGKMLHAPRSGTNVRIDPIGNRNPAAVRRVT